MIEDLRRSKIIELHRMSKNSSIEPLRGARRLVYPRVMSVSRPARCVFSAPAIPRLRPRVRCRNFHTSLSLCERKPKHPSIKAADMGLVEKQKQIKERAQENFKPYTEKEKEALAAKYTPEQLAAIEAGEAAIDPVDINERGVIRSDWGTLDYLDDFSKMRTMVDRDYFNQDGPKDPNARIMTEQESMEADQAFLQKVYKENPLPEDFNAESEEDIAKVRPNRTDLLRSADEVPSAMGTHGPMKEPSLLAPGVPVDIESQLDEGEVLKKKLETKDEEDSRDPDGRFDGVRKQTGMSLDDIFKLNLKTLVSHRVVNQTRLGKIQSMYVLAICGNGDGKLGIGEAKGQEMEDAMTNARVQAIKSMRPIPRYEDRTIFGEVKGKVSAAEVELSARPPGKVH